MKLSLMIGICAQFSLGLAYGGSTEWKEVRGEGLKSTYNFYEEHVKKMNYRNCDYSSMAGLVDFSKTRQVFIPPYEQLVNLKIIVKGNADSTQTFRFISSYVPEFYPVTAAWEIENTFEVTVTPAVQVVKVKSPTLTCYPE